MPNETIYSGMTITETPTPTFRKLTWREEVLAQDAREAIEPAGGSALKEAAPLTRLEQIDAQLGAHIAERENFYD